MLLASTVEVCWTFVSMVLASMLGIGFGPAAPGFSAFLPRHILYVGIVGVGSFIYIWWKTHQVCSAALGGVRDTFFDEPTDRDVICRYQNKIEFVSFCFVNWF